MTVGGQIWDARGWKYFVDSGDVLGLTQAVNGGLTGLRECPAPTLRAMHALRIVRVPDWPFVTMVKCANKRQKQ